MTKNQLQALKHLCIQKDYSEYVHMNTAYALSDCGFVTADTMKSITMGGNFPHYLCSLTDKGKQYCLIQFGKN